MSVSVQFAGQTYSVPEDEEVGWENLTNLLVALAGQAATTQSMSFNTRTSTITPQTLQATDTVLCMNVATASVVNLPSGVAKQFYFVADVSGAAQTNNITVTPSGGQLINGAANYVIDANNGAVLLQFNGTQWVILSQVSDVFKTVQKQKNNTTNKSFVPGTISSEAGATANNLQSCSAAFSGSNLIAGTVSLDSGESFAFSTDFAKGTVSAHSDVSSIFLTEDSGTGIFISKPTASSVLTFKNRMGVSKVIEIKSLTTNITSPTVWA